ncbi:hypothetical protein [Pseudomonas anguilliseptica]|uniref:hypothetical protein n=1 Tax=Pseudomonas anguilliseptica TaxID=53406 RepID=UPI003735EEDD
MFPLAISPELALQYNLGDDLLSSSTNSKHGYEVAIHNGTAWNTTIEMFVPGMGFRKHYFPSLIHEHPLIEYSARKFIQYQLENSITTRGIEILCRLLQKIAIDVLDSEKITTEKIFNWIDRSLQSIEPKEESTFTAIRNYITFCVEEEYWAFNESLLWLIESTTFKRAKSGAAAFRDVMLDANNGPYTQSQLVVIFQTATICVVDSTERALLTLCRDLGLRPVQIALLREEDFISDIRGCYLRVPRVKGYKRSALRRKSSNFVERFLSETLAAEISLVIKENNKLFQELDRSLDNRRTEKAADNTRPAHPLFPVAKLTDRHMQLYSKKTTREYTYHLTNYEISRKIRKLTQKLNIKSKNSQDETSVLQIAAYRFRRTKATMMAIQGYSPEEIAYALDHSSLSSVRHYVNFSKDLIDFVNLSATSSIEITTLKAYWEGKFVKEHKPGESEIRLSKIDSLGLCSLNGECKFHPTVTCYGCNKFKPYLDGSHRMAYENIIHTQNLISTDSSGPVGNQLAFAAKMALQCAEEAEKLND